MSTEQVIHYGESRTCSIDPSDSSVALERADPEHTLTIYPVHGLAHGKLSIVVVRTSIPAIVRVEASNEGSDLSPREIEQIRVAAERIVRAAVG